MEYLNTWNCDLKSYYGYHWNSNKLDNARDKMEKYYTRIKKYINKYKTKELTFEHGCFNMNVVDVSLTDMYKLVIFLGDGKKINIDLVSIIEYDVKMRYDNKYHSIYFLNL